MAELGYTPKSAVDRPIKNGQKYDKYFQKIEGKRIVLKRDGSVHDTVEYMKQMVNDYSYQTDKIAKVLAVYDSKGNLDQYKTCKNIWQFVFDYIKYNYEKGEQLQTPAHTWYQAQIMARKHPENAEYSADCDCMAIFCGCCFKSLNIPFSFRIAGYANILGFAGGYQHVYAIAHCNGKNVFCDPVTNEFDYEKPPAIKETFPMSLNGTDIVMLSGIDNGNIYVENPDGSLGLLQGKKKQERKVKKKAKRQAKKDKRAAKQEIKQARRSGDKEALAKAKAKKQDAKQRIDENRTGIAKAISKTGKFVKNTTMLVPRAMFLMLLRLNFRGMARKFANNKQAYEKFASVWKRVFGGKTSKLDKAINKGKNKKALFGAKKNLGNLAEQLDDIGEVYYDLGYITDDFLDSLEAAQGLGSVMASVGAAMASALPIIKKVLSIFGEVGEAIPETAEEAEQQGYESYTVSDDYQFESDDDDYIDIDDADEDYDYSEDDYDFGRVVGSAVKDYSDGVYFIDDAISGLSGEYLGLGLFVGQLGALGKAKKVKAKKAEKKQKRATKKIAKANKKAEKKQKSKAKKSAKVEDKRQSKLSKAKTEKQKQRINERADKKQSKIAKQVEKANARAAKKVEKQNAIIQKFAPALEPVSLPTPAPSPMPISPMVAPSYDDDDFDDITTSVFDVANQVADEIMPPEPAKKNVFDKIKQGFDKVKDAAINVMQNDDDDMETNDAAAYVATPPAPPEKQGIWQKYKVPIVVTGGLALLAGIWYFTSDADGNKKKK